ncbi:MAG: type I-E CRISPR-associated protein Cse1/CasA [Anaerolineaceae bacterium]|nr:type I-E CRISPR-associated protein Cse1/CasA [Anaerolineaceae bacterium]
MKPSFDLCRQPWLPCVRLDGQPATLGLGDALAQAHLLRDLQGETPLETAALHRLLLALLHRVFGPDSHHAWAALWQQGRWEEEAVRGYLERWRGRFDLFDEAYPFYQTADTQAEVRPINKVAVSLAYNNATLFEHQMEDESLCVSPARAARWLVTFQCSGVGTGPPNNPYPAGPLANTMIVMPQGRTLFETLMLNLLRYSNDHPMPSGPDDRPIWEHDKNPYPPSPKTFYRPGYLAYLTWQSRTIRLLPHEQDGAIRVRECHLAQGARWDSSLVEDPMKVYVRDEKRGTWPLRLRQDRAMWRDSHALFRLHDRSFRPPLALLEMADQVEGGTLRRDQTYDYLVLGLSNDNASLNFYRQERMPLPLAYLAEDEQGERLRDALFQALQGAEDAADALRKAGRDLAAWVVSPVDRSKAYPQDVSQVYERLRIESGYWPRLEVPFRRFIQDLPLAGQPALDAWLDLVLQTTRGAFEQAAESACDPLRGLKAATLARGTLERFLAKAIGRKEE